jgi:hypothetical protein
VAVPRNPDYCFVLFSKSFPNRWSVACALESLLNQVQQIDDDRLVKQIIYDAEEHKLSIEFEAETP